MKRLCIVMLAGSLGLAATCLAQAPDLSRMDIVLKSVPDGPVARVRGTSIPAEDFIRLYQTELTGVMLQSDRKEIPEEVRLELGFRCLAMLVQREVLYQEALSRKLSVSDVELEQAWQEELKRVQASLGAKENVSEQELLDWAGVTRESALAEARKEMLVAKVREAIAKEKGVKVSKAEIAEAFEKRKQLFKRPDQCHAKQIFAAYGTEEGAEPTAEQKERARKRIEKALQRIYAGETFEAVARDLSQAPDREREGDMGMMPMKALPPFYADAAYALKPGEMSEIIESEFGFHLIKLVEFVPGAEADLEKAEPFLRKMLFDDKAMKAVNTFCDPVLNEKGAVQVFLEFEKTLAFHPNAEQLMKALARDPQAAE